MRKTLAALGLLALVVKAESIVDIYDLLYVNGTKTIGETNETVSVFTSS